MQEDILKHALPCVELMLEGRSGAICCLGAPGAPPFARPLRAAARRPASTWVGTLPMPRKWTNGVSTNGVTAFTHLFFDGLFGYSCQGVLVYQFVSIHYFCSGPVSVDPICQQPNAGCLRGNKGVPVQSYLRTMSNSQFGCNHHCILA